MIPHALDRLPLVRLVAESHHLAVAGEVWDAASLASPPAVPPAVILLALTLLGQRAGIGMTAVSRRFPGVPIVALAPHGEDECLALSHASPEGRLPRGESGDPLPDLDCLTLAVLQGARGAIRRGITPDELLRVLSEVAHGGLWYDESLSRRIVTWARLTTTDRSDSFLSPRESDVAAWLAEGRSNKEIALGLGLSEPTVKRHVGRLLRRFHLADRLQLGLFLNRHGFLIERLRTPEQVPWRPRESAGNRGTGGRRARRPPPP